MHGGRPGIVRIGGRGGASSEDARVANMSEQQFENYMNELHMRDNKKPLKADFLSQLPRIRFQGNGEEGASGKKDE